MAFMASPIPRPGSPGLEDAGVGLVKLKGVRVVVRVVDELVVVWVLLLPAFAPPPSPNDSPFEIPSLSESLSPVCAYTKKATTFTH